MYEGCELYVSFMFSIEHIFLCLVLNTKVYKNNKKKPHRDDIKSINLCFIYPAYFSNDVYL